MALCIRKSVSKDRKRASRTSPWRCDSKCRLFVRVRESSPFAEVPSRLSGAQHSRGRKISAQENTVDFGGQNSSFGELWFDGGRNWSLFCLGVHESLELKFVFVFLPSLFLPLASCVIFHWYFFLQSEKRSYTIETPEKIVFLLS